MSLLDSIEKKQVDILGKFVEQPSVEICHYNKMPIEYLSDDGSRFRIYLQVQNSWSDEGHSMRVAQQISEYLCSVPCIKDVSTCVLTPIPYGLTWTSKMYEMLVISYPNPNSAFHCYMLMISFNVIRVHTYYSLLKLFMILRNNGPYRFPRTSAVVLTWIYSDYRRYLEINDSFLRQIGIKQKDISNELYDSRIMDTLKSLCCKLEISDLSNVEYWNKMGIERIKLEKAVEKYWNRNRMSVG